MTAILHTTISNRTLTAQINHLGAELTSLQNDSNKEYIWEGNPAFWGKHSPILFPIVGTLKNNSYVYKEKEFHLSRHGFARDMEFEVVKKSSNSVSFSLLSTLETKKKYPFDFELQITYTLNENALDIEYKVSNLGTTPMPFSIGAHPAFSLNGNFENYAIEFETDEKLDYFILDNDLISNETKTLKLEDKKVALNYSLFKEDALIFKSLKSKSVTILENLNPLLKVNFKDFPSLGLWTKEGAPFLCIEPWFGYADTVNQSGTLFDKEGIQILSEKAVFNSKFSIEIL